MIKKLLEVLENIQKDKLVEKQSLLIKVYEKRIELLEERAKLLEKMNSLQDEGIKKLARANRELGKQLDLCNTICKN